MVLFPLFFSQLKPNFYWTELVSEASTSVDSEFTYESPVTYSTPYVVCDEEVVCSGEGEGEGVVRCKVVETYRDGATGVCTMYMDADEEELDLKEEGEWEQRVV